MWATCQQRLSSWRKGPTVLTGGGAHHSIHDPAVRAPAPSEGGRRIPPATQRRLASEQRHGSWPGPSRTPARTCSLQGARLLWGLASLFRPVPTPMDVVAASWWRVWPGSPARHPAGPCHHRVLSDASGTERGGSWQCLRLGRPGPVTQQPGMPLHLPGIKDSGVSGLFLSVVSVCLPLPISRIFSYARVMC